ncbi:MAG TPA: phosphoenolpyruvate carboxykinase (ATP) [Candidatus Sulfopaludibacter sp.]|jgi:phosphoenolpyruvate carboxykinase (ATP)|nr:phosphoenolpyruvate carboxykinase (ATP) [Candidatus Sulfopaludibacter sp.]
MLIDQKRIANAGIRPSRHGLELHGLHNLNVAYWNLGTAQLVEHAIQRREGNLASGGALVVRTGQFTGRSPKDKFVVRDEITDPNIHWGAVNQPISEAHFDQIYKRMMAFWQGHDVYVQDCFVGADPEYTLPVRVISQVAWHNLFARQLFIRPDPLTTEEHKPEFTILFAPDFQTNPGDEGTNSETGIVISFKRRCVLICGTSYAGEMKKSAFTIMNYLLPERGVFPMHCSANVGAAGDVALFFGLSGTGKTTLSADPNRRLIGDDEHGWSENGVFNFEGGCYAKCIRLSQENEPQIWNAIRFGTVLENVSMDSETRLMDFDSAELTENTRAAYPLKFIEGAVIPSVGGHPSNVVFLTADAFGVLPPVSRLTPEQAMYHFLSGYTAKVAGTERGLGKEPEATFSACFGAPFLPRPAATYAALLGEKLRRHKANCWLINSGWAGGPYGVGERMKLRYTRAMVNAVLSGELDQVPMTPHPVFGVAVPQSCPGVPPQFLDARGMWADKSAYDKSARDLARRFNKNFEKFTGVSPEIAAAAPVER